MLWSLRQQIFAFPLKKTMLIRFVQGIARSLFVVWRKMTTQEIQKLCPVIPYWSGLDDFQDCPKDPEFSNSLRDIFQILCLCVSVSLCLPVSLFLCLSCLWNIFGFLSFLVHLCPDACCLCVFFSGKVTLASSCWPKICWQGCVTACLCNAWAAACLALPCLLFTGKLASASSFTVLPLSRGATCHVSPRVPSDRASSPLLGLPSPHPCPPVTPCKHTQKFTSLRSQQKFGQSANVWPPNSWCIEKCHHGIRAK